ncbi:type VI secretion system baseplate subunit TssE [Pseudoxanthomonas putridarboris]|uniref:Type VI secretion system baseplate subunit TssE n=1 Tax=Pseudoxanthomonas putridarboris TaxID=752605 RepID=A0ABU9J545_9GAMM
MSRELGRGSLFERLNPEAPLRRSLQARNDLAERVQGIKRQIESLLNARQGCSQSSPDLGLPDFNNSASGSADLLIRMARSIRELIEAYEPRVAVRDVHLLPNPDTPLELTFRLDCVMTVNTHEEALEMDLILNGHNRHYSVI